MSDTVFCTNYQLVVTLRCTGFNNFTRRMRNIRFLFPNAEPDVSVRQRSNYHQNHDRDRAFHFVDPHYDLHEANIHHAGSANASSGLSPRGHETETAREQQVLADTVEKLRFTMPRKFQGIFQSPGAQVTDQLYRSELRQAGFSCDFCYPLVATVDNAAQIANEIAAHFETEFFNTIGRSLPPRLY